MISIAFKNHQNLQKSTFHDPPQTPTSKIVFWAVLPHFSTDFIKKRCQNVQEIILHPIQGSPKEFETSHIYSPPLIINPLIACQLSTHIQNGSIKPLLRFEGRCFLIGGQNLCGTWRIPLCECPLPSQSRFESC